MQIGRLLGAILCFVLLTPKPEAVGASREHQKSNGKICVSPATASKFLESTKETGGLGRSRISEQGNIVILDAAPGLLIRSNVFDLSAKTIQFLPAPRGRYTYLVGANSFNGQATRTLFLRDDDSYELVLKRFQFPFGKNLYDRFYVNSNGNITFSQPDPDPPNVESLSSGPDRIAALFADLDLEHSGTIFVNETSEKVTISWLKVPEFFNQNQFGYGRNTFQITLYQDGRIDLAYSDELTATQAITGVFGRSSKSPFTWVDFSKQTSKTRPSTSFIENFRDYESIDIAQAMKSLYENIKDKYDFVTLLSNFDLTPVPGAQAFAINVRNTTSGIGDPSEIGSAIFSENEKYGSTKALENITFLGNLHQYPSDPSRRIADNQTSLLGILAHEVGHRWLSYIRISKDGVKSTSLLGRDKSHWSFFLDSGGSFLEGNEIVQKSSNTFVTHTPFQRYSELDLYLMGLFAPEEVPDIVLVESAHEFKPSFTFVAESAPEAKISFKGSAIPVRIEDIIAENGRRKPSSSKSQKTFYHLFVLITKTTTPATPEDIAYLDLLRTQWEAYFFEMTRGRAQVGTLLQ